MLKTSAVAVCACLLVASPTLAADFGRPQSRIGEIFADSPPSVARIRVYERPAPAFIGTALKLPGYYGTPRDFEYRNYYGTSPLAIYSRLPYACGFVGLC